MVFLALLLRDLNAIAPLVTLFFLITYAMINVVVIIEQNLGLISFRPLFVSSPMDTLDWSHYLASCHVYHKPNIKPDFRSSGICGLWNSFQTEIDHSLRRCKKRAFCVICRMGCKTYLNDITSTGKSLETKPPHTGKRSPFNKRSIFFSEKCGLSKRINQIAWHWLQRNKW